MIYLGRRSAGAKFDRFSALVLAGLALVLIVYTVCVFWGQPPFVPHVMESSK